MKPVYAASQRGWWLGGGLCDGDPSAMKCAHIKPLETQTLDEHRQAESKVLISVFLFQINHHTITFTAAASPPGRYRNKAWQFLLITLIVSPSSCSNPTVLHLRSLSASLPVSWCCRPARLMLSSSICLQVSLLWDPGRNEGVVRHAS